MAVIVGVELVSLRVGEIAESFGYHRLETTEAVQVYQGQSPYLSCLAHAFHIAVAII